MRTLAILPVKSFTRAKQRLDPTLHPQARQELAQAMLADVLNALGDAALDGIIVVTAGERARAIAREHGARVVEDHERGHNAAAALGIQAAIAEHAERALLVPGDCPALDPFELNDLLRHNAPSPSAVIVPDRHGTGTNALLLTPPDSLSPSFGPDSCRRHHAGARAAGAHVEVIQIPSLALDIDTAEDLAALACLSDRAPRTSELLSRC
jgi:2-phospho-L-lactate/phosphoenolpyruvate guanylyltransferase